jgi:hypothetical protein
MSSRKQLAREIATLEKELLTQQIHNYQHKRYLMDIVNNHKFVALALLIPIVIVGWRMASTKTAGHVGKQLGNIVFLATAANLRKKLWRAVSALI